ncbi:hypothetical protein Bpfe_010408 [Biomphalaria pfeifferi]|uniref:Uncharacterized protein n=1 Tax=Biomphalaria pfeifferi TaxID=112525 RepID=A0AAD8BST6_BIOPF|nr:hypothetical protein Bpfe_010408 [Biomphalaria pfeifferi]
MWSKMTDEYVQSDGTLRKVTKWRPVNKEGSFNDLVRVVQSQSNLEDSLDVSPICSNSKAQTISFTNQKYIVNSCVIVKYGEIFYPGVVIGVLDDQCKGFDF